MSRSRLRCRCGRAGLPPQGGALGIYSGWRGSPCLAEAASVLGLLIGEGSGRGPAQGALAPRHLAHAHAQKLQRLLRHNLAIDHPADRRRPSQPAPWPCRRNDAQTHTHTEAVEMLRSPKQNMAALLSRDRPVRDGRQVPRTDTIPVGADNSIGCQIRRRSGGTTYPMLPVMVPGWATIRSAPVAM